MKTDRIPPALAKAQKKYGYGNNSNATDNSNNNSDNAKETKAPVVRPDIRRGQMYYIENDYVDMDDSSGDTKPRRTAVVVSNDIGNSKSNMIIVVYTTTRDKKYMPTHVEIEGVNGIRCTAFCEKIDTVSKVLVRDFVRNCTREEMAEINKALFVSLLGYDWMNEVSSLLPSVSTQKPNVIVQNPAPIIRYRDSSFDTTSPLLNDVSKFIGLLTEKCRKINELDKAISEISEDSFGNLRNVLDEESLKEVVSVATKKITAEKENVENALKALLIPEPAKAKADKVPEKNTSPVVKKVGDGQHNATQTEQIIKLTNEGLSVAEITKKLNVKQRAVYDVRHNAKKKGLILV